jgi:hypothetical protein
MGCSFVFQCHSLNGTGTEWHIFLSSDEELAYVGGQRVYIIQLLLKITHIFLWSGLFRYKRY